MSGSKTGKKKSEDVVKSRREFLIGGGLVLGYAGLSGLAFPAKALAGKDVSLLPVANPATGKLPILQGLTSETEAQFRVLRDARVKTTYRFQGPRGEDLAWSKLDEFKHAAAVKDAVDHVFVSGLSLGADYRLQVIDEVSGKVLDDRIFTALDTREERARFAVLSCMSDTYSWQQAEMWAAVAKAKPAMIFLIGDSCYADQGSDGTEGGVWKRFLESRKMFDGFRWQRLIPTLAVWDDHDFGINNGDKTNPIKHGVKDLFQAMMGSDEKAGFHEKGPGVASVTSLFGQRFFLMDDRFFRDPAGTKNGMHWGEEQEEWLFSQIAKSDEPAWLFNGSQFFGEYLAKESFEGLHKEQFKRVLQRLSREKAPVVFGSGDVHFSELMTIEPELLGYETFELTSSSLHSYNYPGMQLRAHNPRRITSTWVHNFLLVESRVQRSQGAGLEIRVQSIGAGGEVRFDERMTVQRG